MANSRSARKRIRADERKHERNRAVRSAVRTKITKARRALLAVDEGVETTDQLVVAISALDRAGEKGILHANNVARRKSRLMALANRLHAASAGDGDAVSAARAAAVGGEKGRKGTAGGRARGTSAKTSTRTIAKAPAAAAGSATRTSARATTRTSAGTGATKSATAKAAAAKGTGAAAKPARARKAD